MKNYSILIILFGLLLFLDCCSHHDQEKVKEQKIGLPINRKNAGLKLQAIYKGRFLNYENGSYESVELLEVNLINDTDSTIEFMTYVGGPQFNVVFNKKVVSFFWPYHHSFNKTVRRIEPGQILSFPIIYYYNQLYVKDDAEPLKVGFIMFTWKMRQTMNEDTDELFQKWSKTQEHIIWTDPIDFSSNPQKNNEFRRIINDTTISYVKSKW